MRPRTELALAMGAVLILATAASVIGRANAPPAATRDKGRASTFLADPGGARGLLEAAQRLGIDVLRFRERPNQLDSLNNRQHQLFAILDPDAPISAPDVPIILAFHKSTDLLIAGDGAENIMRCFGYKVERTRLDSVRVDGPQATAAFVHASLLATQDSVYTDTTRMMDVGRIRCVIPKLTSTRTLLSSPRGPVVVRLEEASGRSVILVSDAALLNNHGLRDTNAGPFILALIAGHYERVVFDEYHHGYGAAGSLGKAVVSWSAQSPWGWAVWQLVGAGVLALLFGAIRFGPALVGIPRVRRSALEHVRALATALSAARGHDQAIAAIVRGLRRRLAPPAMRARGDWKEWLVQRNRRARSPQERESLTTLTTLTQPGQPPTSVLQAANAVEDLWQSLQH